MIKAAIATSLALKMPPRCQQAAVAARQQRELAPLPRQPVGKSGQGDVMVDRFETNLASSRPQGRMPPTVSRAISAWTLSWKCAPVFVPRPWRWLILLDS
jgi:hypothetical protein